jgi:DNA polymerase III subunit gamma/tau
VIETGQDPRRFGEDLLRRLRDLVIIAEVPDAPAKGIIDVPDDQAERLVAQAARFGRADLARAADILSQGLTEMRGATAPRLLLELVCARVLLPGADDSTEGIHARLDRIERRMAIGGTVSAERPAPAPAETTRPAATPESAAAPPEPPAAETAPEPDGPDQGAPEQRAPEQDAPRGEQQSAPPAAQPTDAGGMSVTEVRRLWPDVLDAVKKQRRFTWIMLSQNAQVSAFDGRTLTVGLTNAGARDRFVSSGSDEILRQALIDVLGVDWRVEAIVDPGGPAGPPSAPQPRPSRPAAPPEPPADSPPEPSAESPAEPLQNPEPSAPPPAEPSDQQAGQARAKASPQSVQQARGAIRPTRDRDAAASGGQRSEHDHDAHPDDPTVDDAGLGHDELLARELGARVIEEIPRD